MLAQVVLTTSEAKQIIAKAIVSMPLVKNALAEGIVMIHPSSTTLPVMQELGHQPEDFWVGGVVRPEALCISPDRQIQIRKCYEEAGRGPKRFFCSTWIFRRGIWDKEQRPLTETIEELGPLDVYIKTGNALDCNGNVGVLHSSVAGGTTGLVSRKHKSRGFQIVLPIGLEKLIPSTILEAARATNRAEIDWAMGQPCGLFPVRGTVVTETHALAMLTATKVTAVAAGGLGYANGASVLVINGEEEKVREAVHLIQSIKGTRTPDLGEVECLDCYKKYCHFRQVSSQGKRKRVKQGGLSSRCRDGLMDKVKA
jgi:hypothetical protein